MSPKDVDSRFTPSLVPLGEGAGRLPPTRFVTSGARTAQLPAHELPEFAVIGRSNVGKSSLLGRLFKKSDLVRTSRTPGRTQLLNLFVFENRMALVDLPGYGYAKLPQAQREQLRNMTAEYLAKRQELRGVVQLFDARREEITQEDRAVSEWILEHGRRLLIVLTKVDLVPKSRWRQRAALVEKALGAPAGAALLVSAKTGEGRDELVAGLTEASQP